MQPRIVVVAATTKTRGAGFDSTSKFIISGLIIGQIVTGCRFQRAADPKKS